MGKIVIRFDKTPAVFEPGETVSGKVDVYLREDVPIREIFLVLRGRAQSSFEVHHGSGRGGTTYHYRAEELYFDKKFLIYSSELPENASSEQPNNSPKAKDCYSHEKNAYEHTFSYELPPSLPTSFESESGCIRYACKVIVKKPFRLNLRKTRLFTVVSPCDLNSNLSAKNRPCDEATAGVGYMCCSSNRGVTATVALPKMGFVPGEVIPIEAKIVNHTSRPLKGSKAKLVRVVKYTGQLIGLEYGLRKPSTEDSIERVQCIAEAVKYEDVPPNDGVQVWSNQGVLIPPIPACLGPCKCIRLSYFIIFKVKPRGLAGVSLSLELPVIIGTVPLMEEVSVGVDISPNDASRQLFPPQSKERVRRRSLYHPLAPIPATFIGTRDTKYLGLPNYDHTPSMKRSQTVDDAYTTVEDTENDTGNDDDNDEYFQPKYGYFNLSMDFSPRRCHSHNESLQTSPLT